MLYLLNKFAQLAVIGITVATGFTPLDAEARGRRGGHDRSETVSRSSNYVPETDYSTHTLAGVQEVILGLESTLDELDEEKSALRSEGKELRLEIRAIQEEIEFSLDVV